MSFQWPFHQRYGYGSEAAVYKAEDGRWRMDGFASGGGWVRLPIVLEAASTKELVDLYFLTSGYSRDWRILSALAEKPLSEVKDQLAVLDPDRKQALNAGILHFMTEYPDYNAWSPEDFS